MFPVRLPPGKLTLFYYSVSENVFVILETALYTWSGGPVVDFEVQGKRAFSYGLAEVDSPAFVKTMLSQQVMSMPPSMRGGVKGAFLAGNLYWPIGWSDA